MFKHYLTTALRHFRQHKLTTSINVVCLTIGLVCFLAIYAMVAYLENGDRHFANADRIYMITIKVDSTPANAMGSWRTAKYLKTDIPELTTIARALGDVGIISEAPVSAGDTKLFASVTYADPEFLDVFALPFLAGDSKNALRSPRSAVISRDTAIRLFGSVPKAIGNTLRLQDGHELTVRGVLDALKQPSHISTNRDAPMGSVHFDVLISMDVFEDEAITNPVKQSLLRTWSAPMFFTYAVLPKDGSFTIESLRSRLNSFGDKHANSGGQVLQFGAVPVNNYRLSIIGAMAGGLKSNIGGALVFYFLGAIVLLTSCLNYANLATAQATTRAKEIGMRRVVGARRGQIVVQFMLEAALLSLTALLCALILTAIGIVAMRSPSVTAVIISAVATIQFWITLLALSVTVTIAAGMYPAFVLSGVRPIHAVRAGKSRSGGTFAPRLLVGLQFAATSFLLISMLVMYGQNSQLKESVLSESSDGMIVLSNDIHAAGIDFDLLRSQLLSQPHIQAVTAAAMSPWSIAAQPSTVSISLDDAARKVPTNQGSISHDYFPTLGIKLLAGRLFDRQYANDITVMELGRSISQSSNIVIDRALAEQNGWQQPIDAGGKTLYAMQYGVSGKTPSQHTIIGVVENRAMGVISPIGATSSMYWFVPKAASYPIIRVSTKDGGAALKEIEAVWNKLAPSVALKMRFANDILNRTYQIIELIVTVFTAVATLALTISMLGLIGMSIQVIGRRQHEIGVRKTLGASVRNIVQLLLTDFSKPVIVANLLAWPIAFFAMRFYLRMFTQQTGLSIVPFVVSLVVTVVIAWTAVATQATRAARMNPATVLRNE